MIAVVPVLLLGLVLTLEPAKPAVTLGEPVELKAHVDWEGPLAGEVAGPRPVLDVRAVTLAVTENAPSFIYRRKLDAPPPVESLAPGKGFTETISFTPVRAADVSFVASYPLTGTDRHVTATARVAVRPAPSGATELGMRLETGKGDMTIRFLPEAAPNHVAHFADLARRGFFDGLTFHRVIRGFMAQGGDPLGTGEGGPGFTLPAEFSTDPRFSHTFGRVSTARDEDPDTGGSQFFICFDGARRLDGKYTVWGELAAGADTLRRIEAIGAAPEEGQEGKPREVVKIARATLVPLGGASGR